MRISFRLLCVVALLAAGCSMPQSEPDPLAGWKPQKGGCHDGFANYMSQVAYDERGCTEPHTYETVYVGQFDSDITELPETAPEAKSAWLVCDKELTAYLGGQWRDRAMRLRVGMPTAKAWRQGERWYSCEAATATDYHSVVTPVQRSFKDGFTSMPELRYVCADVGYQGIHTPRRCDEPHNAEFVSHLPLEMSYEELAAELHELYGPVAQACREAVAVFADVQYMYTGVWLMTPSETEWNTGDHSVRCYLWLEGVKVSKSLQGVGARRVAYQGSAHTGLIPVSLPE